MFHRIRTKEIEENTVFTALPLFNLQLLEIVKFLKLDHRLNMGYLVNSIRKNGNQLSMSIFTNQDNYEEQYQNVKNLVFVKNAIKEVLSSESFESILKNHKDQSSGRFHNRAYVYSYLIATGALLTTLENIGKGIKFFEENVKSYRNTMNLCFAVANVMFEQIDSKRRISSYNDIVNTMSKKYDANEVYSIDNLLGNMISDFSLRLYKLKDNSRILSSDVEIIPVQKMINSLNNMGYEYV